MAFLLIGTKVPSVLVKKLVVSVGAGGKDLLQ